MDNLFTQQSTGQAPLAERLRPTTIDNYVGQEDLVGEGSLLRSLLEKDQIPSMIFWGPPGSGKTTLAHIIANTTNSAFEQLSATSSGKKDLQSVVAQAQQNADFHQQRTILFVDEIHRWNKAQQDALLPAVEKGTIILIGATTENPSFEVNSALLSRSHVFVLKQLSGEQIAHILQEGAKKLDITLSDELAEYIGTLSNGDARSALNTLELAAQSGKELTKEAIAESVQKTFIYDKSGEEHFNLISALHKTMRASDPDAALYWLARMLESGEDPLYVARRIVRFASEDVGNESSAGLMLAVSAYQASHYLGMPECALALAQAVEYLAKAPKSRAIDDAWAAIQRDIQEHPHAPVPMHLRNAPTELMKDLGYGKKEGENPSNLPEELANKKYI